VTVDLGPVDLDGLTITGDGPVLPSIYQVDTAAATAVGAATLAISHLWQDRGGAPWPGPASATVDTRHAAASFRSERYLRVDGTAPPIWGELSGDYRARDGWVKLHANYPNHRDAVLVALGVPQDRAAVARAVSGRSAVEVEDAVVAANGAAAAMRTPQEWADHPQSRAVAALPLVAFTRLADSDSPALPLSPADRPLETVRVLDVTRVLAGPVAGRVLASYGAHVLRVGADHLPLVAAAFLDTGFGKRFCHLDLRTGAGRETLRGLIAQADVVLQAYRPDALRRLGFGPAECAALRPGLVYVSISAWGRSGPWRGRRGFDSLVQMACGIAAEGARAAATGTPCPLPAQALDHATGWFAAWAAVEGLRRRHREGGSWLAELSLARTAGWLDSLGRVPDGLAVPEPDLDPYTSTMDSYAGELRYVRPPGRIPGCDPVWPTPPHAPGADPARWW
jgi:crotonobetainyl-CoA:carnitine CoA-transferase CaiB-like acyl-CoA transferase